MLKKEKRLLLPIHKLLILSKMQRLSKLETLEENFGEWLKRINILIFQISHICSKSSFFQYKYHLIMEKLMVSKIFTSPTTQFSLI